MLSVDEQIAHMKQKGITFSIVSEAEAKEFLTNNNYYMKLAAYRTNYNKCQGGRRDGQYEKLDFAYLKELSTLDMRLRYFVLEMCLDIEHAVKVKLIARITQNPDEDGYDIVRRFLSERDTSFRILRELQNRKSGEYSRNLVSTYYPYFPAWVFVELISFGTLLHFADFYGELYQDPIADNALMNTVRDLRNAAAHSNCLMLRLGEPLDPTKQPHANVYALARKANSQNSCNNNLGCKFAYNITTLLYVYDSLVADAPKAKRYAQLKDFLDHRAVRNADYFKTNTKITGTYHFLKKVVDNLAASA